MLTLGRTNAFPLEPRPSSAQCSKRVDDAIDAVVFRLHEKSKRRLADDRDIRIQLNTGIGVQPLGRLTNHKFLFAEVCFPLRRAK
jgi:hypothetical protein